MPPAPPLGPCGAAPSPDCLPHLHCSKRGCPAYPFRMTLLQRAIEESVVATRSLGALEQPLKQAAKLVLQGLTTGHKLLVCRKGGSASDATHVATEVLCPSRNEC